MKVVAIFGPPGTGKTRKLVEIAHKEAERSRGVLYLSYTRAAAQEALSRSQDNRIRPSTIHSFAFNALGMQRASVVDAPKLKEFAKATGIPFKGSERGSDELQEGDEYQTVLEYAHNRIIPPMQAWEQFGCPGTRQRFEWFVESYGNWKKEYGYMDFDDMLDHFIKSSVSERSAEVVILDEAQDCTPLQWLAFIKATEWTKRVYIAGDDDQAIYEWSGANPHGMIDFAKEHDGDIRILDQSWRVPEPAYLMSQALIEGVEERVPKEFRPREAKSPPEVMNYGDIWDLDLRKYAASKEGAMILVRDGWRRQEVQKELNRMLIPYEVHGAMSPWTNKTAQELLKGNKPEIPTWWREFYDRADLTQPIRIQLSTVHQAKGREHPRVIVDAQCPARVLHNIGLNRDAEIRVWYVALTRTSNELIVCGENPVL